MQKSIWKNVELPKDISNKLRMFLSENKIRYETSGADNLIHFEILCNDIQESYINDFLNTI